MRRLLHPFHTCKWIDVTKYEKVPSFVNPNDLLFSTWVSVIRTSNMLVDKIFICSGCLDVRKDIWFLGHQKLSKEEKAKIRKEYLENL